MGYIHKRLILMHFLLMRSAIRPPIGQTQPIGIHASSAKMNNSIELLLVCLTNMANFHLESCRTLIGMSQIDGIHYTEKPSVSSASIQTNTSLFLNVYFASTFKDIGRQAHRYIGKVNKISLDIIDTALYFQMVT